MDTIKKRILDISFKHNLCHIGSCMSVVPILWDIYSQFPNDVIILSNGHAGVAQYVMLEHFFGFDAEKLLLKHGVHPCFDLQHKIYASTGSLGQGLPIAIGYALAGHKTHCVISDGECAEGSIWESLSFIDDYEVPINVYVCMNGLAAYQSIDEALLHKKLILFYPKIKIYYTSNDPLPNEIESHYKKLTLEEKIEYEKKIC